jgi:serine/threonine protein kinase
VVLKRFALETVLFQSKNVAVYSATDLSKDVSSLVVKVARTPFEVAQLRSEFAMLTTTLHGCTGIPQAIACDNDGHDTVLVESPRGISLAKYSRENSCTRVQLESWACQLATILDRIHRRGVLHRDIKPDNIVLLDDGCVILIDFGLCVLNSEVGAASRAATPSYASNHVLKKQPPRKLDDYISLAYSLYALEVGVRAFERAPDRIDWRDIPSSSVASYMLDHISDFKDPVKTTDSRLTSQCCLLLVAVVLVVGWTHL